MTEMWTVDRPWTSEIEVPLAGYKPKYNLPVDGSGAVIAAKTMESLSTTARVQKLATTKARKELWLASASPGVDTVRQPVGMSASTNEPTPPLPSQQTPVLLQVCVLHHLALCLADLYCHVSLMLAGFPQGPTPNV